MEFAPQTPGEPWERSLGEPWLQAAASASDLNNGLRRVTELMKLSKIKKAFFAVFYWIFIIQRENKH